MSDWEPWGKYYHKKVLQGWDNGAAMAYADQKEREYFRKIRIPELNYIDPDTGDEVWVHREIQ